MRSLKNLGFINPVVRVVNNPHSKIDGLKFNIILYCDNAFEKPRNGKIFSYFEKNFQEFMIALIQNGLFEKFSRIVNEEEVDRNNIIPELTNYLEEIYEEHLKSTESSWADEVKKLSASNAFPKLMWRRAKNSTLIQADNDDKENGYLVHCIIPKSVAKEKEEIAFDKEIQAIIENVLYSENINPPKISVYYKVVDESEIQSMRFTPVVKELIFLGRLAISIIPTNQNTESKFERSIHLRVTQSFEQNKN